MMRFACLRWHVLIAKACVLFRGYLSFLNFTLCRANHKSSVFFSCLSFFPRLRSLWNIGNIPQEFVFHTLRGLLPGMAQLLPASSCPQKQQKTSTLLSLQKKCVSPPFYVITLWGMQLGGPHPQLSKRFILRSLYGKEEQFASTPSSSSLLPLIALFAEDYQSSSPRRLIHQH